jgi:biopolymer transport protein ExbB/TolQ
MSLNLLFSGGAMIWLILASSALAIVVFIERLLHYHRAQIHSAESAFPGSC